MTDKKTTIITIISMMTSLLLVTIGLSFAYFTANITNNEDSTTINVTGGKMTIHYNGGEAINAPNIEPSNEAFITKEFTLTGNNTTDLNMSYHILLIVEENTFSDNSLQYKLISTNTDNNGSIAPSIEELTGIPTGNNEIFLGNANFTSPTNGSKVHTYKLELYFPDTIEDQNENQGKIFKAYINIKENKYEYNQIKGVNHPVLFTGMTPVKWDSEFNEIETIESDPDWYNYTEKRWANAKSKDGSYWVWIPRYAYKIETCYHMSGEDCLAETGIEAGEIDVKFLKNRTNKTIDETIIETEGYEPGVKDTSLHYFLHPTFDFDDGQLGFWMAKFEVSAHEGLLSGTTGGSCNSLDNDSTKSPLVAPNKTSWRCINISNAFKATLAMKDNTIYGWLPEEIDTHMLTNQEWGAVAYLSKSKYGAHNLEVWNNSFRGFQTGCAGPSVSAHSQDSCEGYEYNTEDGVKASTTHNIYGVYDMSGGAWEMSMANYNNLLSKSEFILEDLILINKQYLTKYHTSENNLLGGVGMAYDSKIYGDAIFETSKNALRFDGGGHEGKSTGSWFSDYSYLPSISSSFFTRGGYWADGTSCGLFNFNPYGGIDIWSTSFRPSLFPL